MKQKLLNLIESTRIQDLGTKLRAARNLELMLGIQEQTKFLDENNPKPTKRVKTTARIYCILNNINEAPRCEGCAKFMLFVSFRVGFQSFCISCSNKNEQHKNNIKRSMLERYGETDPFKVGNAKQKFKEKYGVNSPLQVPKFLEKLKNTNLEKLGVEGLFQDKKFQESAKATMLEKYGVDHNFKNIKAMKEAMLRKYGVEYPAHVPEVIEKTKKTCLERYGSERYGKFGSKEFEENMIKKFGKANFAQTDEFKEAFDKFKDKGLNKQKQTNLEKYGVENYFQSKDFKELHKNEKWLNNKTQRCHESKKANGSYEKSNIEEKIYQMLIEKYTAVERQYSDKRYPFACDFYMPEIDLFIEYQGGGHHGREPFDPTNFKHLAILEAGKDKSLENNGKGERKLQYETATFTGTERDPLKRKIAQENRLNGMEFFTLTEFENGYFS